MTTKVNDTWTEWVCVDCIIALANDDWPDPIPDPKPLALYKANDIEAHPGGEHHADCPSHDPLNDHGCTLDCETDDFSTSVCDGCGSKLAGSRHAVTIWMAGPS
jgi:hypothetical protein